MFFAKRSIRTLLAVLALARSAAPRIVTGSVDTVASWQFLDRFVFHNNDDAVDEEDAGWDSDMSDPEDNR